MAKAAQEKFVRDSEEKVEAAKRDMERQRSKFALEKKEMEVQASEHAKMALNALDAKV